MGIEIAAALAPVVVRLVLPYVKQGAKTLSDQLSDKVGQATAEAATSVAGRVWDRVKEALSSSGEAAVVDQFEARPEASEKLLEEVLRERLVQDPQLAADLRALVDQEIDAGRDVVQIFGHGGVAYAGDVHGGGIVAGNIEHLEGQPPPPTPPKTTETQS
jgi:hypothetical protein